ncbi:Serpin-Z1 [Triticum urartu]|uniref:Serpin-Z1 n=1 Tax=Triticum urartu TaxID=4572 RepID=M7ZSQ5_TRIUA|nr:Serpin-Z1 [Triticum urartu]
MEDLAGAIRDLAALSTRLLLQLSGDGEKRNLAISPLSIHSVLVLLAAGATGDTLDQIVSFLGLSGGAAHAALASEVATLVFGRADGVEPQIRCAVGVWVDASLRLRPAFADKVASKFKAAVRATFRENVEEARVEINRWFEDKTGGFIKDLMPEGHLDAISTVLVIGNALYMRGTWLDPFIPYNTLDDDFFLPDADGSRVRVPFMTSTNDQRISCHPGFKVLLLPYESKGNHEFSMHIYLPDERDGLQALVREISSSGTAVFVARCVPAARGVEVGNLTIPKFKVSSKMDAGDVLQGLGLELPFRFTHDWSEMIELAEPLKVQNVLHECVVEVDEDGTMAAAATEADCDVFFFCLRKTVMLGFLCTERNRLAWTSWRIIRSWSSSGRTRAAFCFESITPQVLELGTNNHFSARTCGIHVNGLKTWLDGANTVLYTPAALTRCVS